MSYCASRFATHRRSTVEVKVGSVGVGGNHPIRIQSMTTSDTQDVAATVKQSIALAEVGCEIIRITAPNVQAAQCLKEIRAQFTAAGFGNIPLVADIHFLPQAAMEAVEHVEKVRVNPGNYADKKKFAVREYSDNDYESELQRLYESFSPLVKRAKTLGRALRIGTNHGSLSDRIMNRYGDSPLGMVESALEFLRIARSHNFHDLILSMKSSNPKVMIQAYRLLVEHMDQEDMHYPLHLGVTEAGDGEDGRIKGAIGIGSLLFDGLGDTLRVSLTEDSVYEVPVARALADKAMSLWPTSTPAPKVPSKAPSDNVSASATPASKLPSKAPSDNVSASATPAPKVPSMVPSDQVRGDSSFSKRPILPSTLGPITFGPELPPRVIVRTTLDALTFPQSPDTPAEILLVPAPKPGTPLPSANRQASAPLVLEFPSDYPLSDASALTLALPSTVAWALALDSAPLAEAWAREAARQQVGLAVSISPLHAAALVPALLRHLPAHRLFFSATTDSRGAGAHATGVYRALAEALLALNVASCIWIRNTVSAAARHDPSFLGRLLEASILTGSLLCDGIGDAVSIETEADPAVATRLAYNVLQGAGARISKTEFVACPSCGRTLFDLQTTTQRIRAQTGHLKGVKLAIMGCIVNGPGEMADADFGYVGGAPGKINLYVGKTCVQYNIPQAEADARLIALIKEHGKWSEPPAHAAATVP